MTLPSTSRTRPSSLRVTVTGLARLRGQVTGFTNFQIVDIQPLQVGVNFHINIKNVRRDHQNA